MGSLFMGYGDAEIALEKLKEILKDLDYSNKLMQLLIDGPNVNWKRLDLLADDQKDNSSAPKLLFLGSYAIHMLHGTSNTR